MTIITNQRTYYQKTPALIAANKWIANKLIETQQDPLLTDKEKNLAAYRFALLDINDIWVEHAIPTTNNKGDCLVCFGVRKRGYAVLDAVCKLITFNDCITNFKIPVSEFDTYPDLVNYIKLNKSFQLYKVKTSSKYGLLDDTNLNQHDRYNWFISALNNVYFDTAISYEDKVTTIINPIGGTIALSHGSMTPITLELYPYQDIIKM